ncbi:MAG: mechanosensitive ion channel family protein [Paraglaciecola sp.]|uniref:mechanosensitive ion channel family protein n=1 Tax=Pseudomonadati TaxID=3379134 RepID=UPI00273F0B61|nr:mechanosensitive ion channel family protein [Paraglaciecola sp.]MDP5032837.1 mechanosensitive ion channel family protein [Paraglaciecola sp.]MDP5040276.1 mechanosensitive ion channel family protein [Paraglaciecola sp.]MDP5129642.1 mechanosensitive ion channel family protein [Paraglaciecola sp.]
MELVLNIVSSQFFLTLIIPSIALTIKFLLVSWCRRRAKSKGDDKRDLINNIKNFINFTLIISLLALWAPELQKFALSIAAFAVAIVLATREFIQCIIGFFYLLSTRPFRIGDWIEVENQIGEVSATDWIKTTLIEVEPRTYQYTGKTLFIPNNKLIASPIKNFNFLKRYASHKFSIIRDQSVNPYVFMAQLQAKAQEYCADFYEVATRYNQMIERRLDVKITGPEPEITVSTTSVGDTVVSFTLFCPTQRAAELEQALTGDFMNLWFAQIKPD